MKKSEMTLKDLPYSQAKRVIEIYEESPFDIRKNDIFVDEDDIEEYIRDIQIEYARDVLSEIKDLMIQHMYWIENPDVFLITPEEYVENQSWHTDIDDYADEHIFTDKNGEDFVMYVLK
jgi:hypothetical protein